MTTKNLGSAEITDNLAFIIQQLFGIGAPELKLSKSLNSMGENDGIFSRKTI